MKWQTLTDNGYAPGDSGSDLAKHILSRLFRNFDGCMRIRLWDGSEVEFGTRPAGILADVPFSQRLQKYGFLA